MYTGSISEPTPGRQTLRCFRNFVNAGNRSIGLGCHFDPAAQSASQANHDDQSTVSESYIHAIRQSFLKGFLRDFYTAHRSMLMYDALTAGLIVEAQKTLNRK
jgi:hypothetical protein